MNLRRRLIPLGLALSLLMVAGCTALWVRSHRVLDTWSRGDAQGQTEVGLLSSRGRLMAWHVTAAPPEAPFARYAQKPLPGFHHSTRRPTRLDRYWLGPPQNALNRAGFGHYSREIYGARGHWLFLPWWATCVLSALPWAAWLHARLTRGRGSPPSAPDPSPTHGTPDARPADAKPDT